MSEISQNMSAGTGKLFPVVNNFDFRELRFLGRFNRHILPPYIELHNISFRVRHEDGYYFLECDKWPILSAFGDTTLDAVRNLNQLVKDVVDDYVFAQEEKLSDDAKEFRSYLISHLMPI